jgi:hypothetical protein
MLTWIVAVVIIVAAVAMFVIARWQKKGLQKNLRLEIRNQGNVPSHYELEAEDPDGVLAFEFRSAGVRLSEGAGSVPETRQVVRSVQKDQPPPPSASAGEPPSTAQIQQKAKQAMGLSKTLADLLGSIGMILPRSIGSPLLQASTQLRRGQSRVEQAERLPRRVSGQAKRVKVVPRSTPGTASTSAQTGTTSGAAAAQHATASDTQAPGQQWVQTPVVRPGESLKLDLLVKPIKARSDQLYSLSIRSRSLEQEDAAVITEEWAGQIKGVGGMRRFHPYLLIVALSILILLLAFWLASLGILS